MMQWRPCLAEFSDMQSPHVGTSFDNFRTGTVISDVMISNNITRKRVMFAGCLYVRMRKKSTKGFRGFVLKKNPH